MRANLYLLLLTTSILIVPGPAAIAGTPVEENTPEACQDGQDNDADGFVDCADQDCSFFVFCEDGGTAVTQPPPPPPPPPPTPKEDTLDMCRDTKDNDGDGYIDCYDQDCAVFAMCLGAGSPHAGGSTSASPPVYEKPPTQLEPRRNRGGIGLFVSVMVFSRGYDKIKFEGSSNDAKVKGKLSPTAGIGIFGEKVLNPHFAIGGEIYLVFPEVDEIKVYDHFLEEWTPYNPCSNCERNVYFAAKLRLKFPFQAGKWVGIFPLLTVGLGNGTHRFEGEDDSNYIGLAYSGGVGIEIYTPAPVTPTIEFRYFGAVGWNTDKDSGVESDMGLLNSLILNIGLRFL